MKNMKARFDYSKICVILLRTLPQKQKEVISRRFALEGKKSEENKVRGETLESIGKSFKITRERVRQIERDGFSRLKPEARKYQKVFDYFYHYLKNKGGFQKEDILFTDLAGENLRGQIFFLLTLGEKFRRTVESKDFYPFWAINGNSLAFTKKTINLLSEKLKKAGKPVALKEITKFAALSPNVILSYLEISKRIRQSSEGLWGLSDWPEINPKGVKDKAYLVFKKQQKPLHFTDVAKLIEQALPQTVHNELIKDQRFILVGRGIYALREWGYERGVVKDVILKILKEARKPLSKEEILGKTLQQRLVKENTVLLNLSNKKYFLRTPEGHYTVQEA